MKWLTRLPRHQVDARFGGLGPPSSGPCPKSVTHINKGYLKIKTIVHKYVPASLSNSFVYNQTQSLAKNIAKQHES